MDLSSGESRLIVPVARAAAHRPDDRFFQRASVARALACVTLAAASAGAWAQTALAEFTFRPSEVGLNGSADLSIVIRTIVVTPQDVTVGVGGAIIDLSDPQQELDEIILKSRALVAALAESAVDVISLAG